MKVEVFCEVKLNDEKQSKKEKKKVRHRVCERGLVKKNGESISCLWHLLCVHSPSVGRDLLTDTCRREINQSGDIGHGQERQFIATGAHWQ